jgi:hypothetical protein
MRDEVSSFHLPFAAHDAFCPLALSSNPISALTSMECCFGCLDSPRGLSGSGYMTLLGLFVLSRVGKMRSAGSSLTAQVRESIVRVTLMVAFCRSSSVADGLQSCFDLDEDGPATDGIGGVTCRGARECGPNGEDGVFPSRPDDNLDLDSGV